jgi:glutathione S-transferase
VLVESAAILDYLDGQVPGSITLLPRGGAARREGLRACALASGMADKAVALLYEHVLRTKPMQNTTWAQRCRAQIGDTAALLEAELSAKGTPYWLGSQLSHADVALTCVLRFALEAHTDWLEGLAVPRLRALAAHCESLPQFQAVVQPLHVQLEPH